MQTSALSRSELSGAEHVAALWHDELNSAVRTIIPTKSILGWGSRERTGRQTEATSRCRLRTVHPQPTKNLTDTLSTGSEPGEFGLSLGTTCV